MVKQMAFRQAATIIVVEILENAVCKDYLTKIQEVELFYTKYYSMVTDVFWEGTETMHYVHGKNSLSCFCSSYRVHCTSIQIVQKRQQVCYPDRNMNTTLQPAKSVVPPVQPPTALLDFSQLLLWIICRCVRRGGRRAGGLDHALDPCFQIAPVAIRLLRKRESRVMKCEADSMA